MIGVAPFNAFFWNAFGHPPGGCPRSPRSICTTESGNGDILVRIDDVRGRQVGRDHHQRKIADHLRRRRYLDDVAEKHVGVGIGAGDFVPAGLQSERARLLLEVGELAARHLMEIDLGRAGAEVGFEGDVFCPHRLEVERDAADSLRIKAGVAVSVSERLDQRAEIGLRRQARHRVHRRVEGVDPGFDRREHRRRRDARRIVRVEVDREIGLLPERRDQPLRRGRLERPAMSLMPMMCAPAFSSSRARST